MSRASRIFVIALILALAAAVIGSFILGPVAGRVFALRHLGLVRPLGPSRMLTRPWLMGGFGSLTLAFTVVLVVLLVAGAAGLFRFSTPPVVATETPLDILKRRYAGGEISKEQFEAMKHDLGL